MARSRKWSSFTAIRTSPGFSMAFQDCEILEELQTPEDYRAHHLYRLMEKLKADNVLHAEVYVSVGVCLYGASGILIRSSPVPPERGRERGERDFGVSLLWIFDAVRQFGARRKPNQWLNWPRRYRSPSVVGFGIGGDERQAAPELFRDVYAYAAANGGSTPYGAWQARLRGRGQLGRPESPAERIGHGFTASQDPELVEAISLQPARFRWKFALPSNLRTGICTTDSRASGTQLF